MATGKDIKEIYDMMKAICQETSNLLIVINDMMESEGFLAVGDSSVMFGKSAHYRYPDYWLPYFLQRVFTKEKNSKKGVGVNITFDGSNDGLENKIPFVTCGVVEFPKDRVTKGNGLYLAGWIDHEDVPKEFDGKICTTTFIDGVITKSYFLPIEILNNQEKVHQYIIKPLISLHEGLIDEVYDMVIDVALGLEDIVE
ncbi:hypothetical protein [Bacillus sp. JJ1764]|uniref:hypothetical protein n=1 Tax=Bacillus sp. JJ1764 TaxID=3122964 RepID=UPI002FFE3D0D